MLKDLLKIFIFAELVKTCHFKKTKLHFRLHKSEDLVLCILAHTTSLLSPIHIITNLRTSSQLEVSNRMRCKNYQYLKGLSYIWQRSLSGLSAASIQNKTAEFLWQCFVTIFKEQPPNVRILFHIDKALLYSDALRTSCFIYRSTHHEEMNNVAK
jgi:hypothetical protein